MRRKLLSKVLEYALTAWIKRVHREGYNRQAAETTLIRAVERRFEMYWNEND